MAKCIYFILSVYKVVVLTLFINDRAMSMRGGIIPGLLSGDRGEDVRVFDKQSRFRNVAVEA